MSTSSSVPGPNVDPTKAQLNNIKTSLAHTFKECASNPKFDPTPAIKAMVQEAYELGVLVREKKLPPIEAEVSPKTTPPAKPIPAKTKPAK